MTPLTARELARLAQTQQVLLSPLAHASPEAWMHAVNAELKELFGADLALFTMGTASSDHFASAELGADALHTYASDFAETDLAGDLVSTLTRGYYVEEDFYRSPTFERHRASTAYNEWYREHGLTDAIGLFAHGLPSQSPDLYARLAEPIVANVLLTGTERCRGAGAGGARTMLALLQPALAASVRTWQQTTVGPLHVAAAIDTLALPFWFFDADGRCLHESAEARQLSARLPGGEELGVSARQLARAMLRGAGAASPVPSARSLEVWGEPLRLIGAYLAPGGHAAPSVIVRVEGGETWMPSETELRERFRLTRREVEVALLRARGARTEAVAEQLGISVHTVRRHTERVMEKLGVRRAAEIGLRLRALHRR
jgi:DNA-binding CsgD family transcriptional regulator